MRIVIGLVVVAVVVWFVKFRGHSDASAAAGGGSGSGSGSAAASGAGAGSGSAARTVPVKVSIAARQDVPIWLEGLGTVAAVQQVTVHTLVDGRLDKVLFVEGQTVKAGQVIAQVDPRPFQVQLETAQGQLARDRAVQKNAEITLKRNQDLAAQNLVAQSAVDQSTSDLGSAAGAVKIDQAAIANAQLQLDYAAIKSPLDGITGVRLVDAGNIIHASDANGLVVITAINPAAVLFTVSQDSLSDVAAAIARGDVPVDVYNRDGSLKLATGKLTVLDNQINQTTATLRMKALMPNENHILWPNAFVKAKMLLDTKKNAMVVPTVAVQNGPTGSFVYVVGDDQTAAMKPVTTSVASGDVTIISKGLDGGEQVITEGQNQIRPGSKVSVIKPGPVGADAGAPGAGSGSGSGGGKHGHVGGGAGSGSANSTNKPTTTP